MTNCQFPTSRPPCAGWPKNGSWCHSCGIHGTSLFGALRPSSAWSTIRRRMLESSASMTLVWLLEQSNRHWHDWSWGHWQWQLQMINNDVTDWEECCFCAGGFSDIMWYVLSLTDHRHVVFGVWQVKQEKVATRVRNLCFAKHRHDSALKPASRFVRHFGAIIHAAMERLVSTTDCQWLH